MARLDITAVWFQRGEDAQALAETPLAKGSEPRRLPAMVWIVGAVSLTALVCGGIIVHRTHAARRVDAPLAVPAVAPATAPAAAPSTQPQRQVQPPPTPATPSTQPASSKIERARDGETLLRHGRSAGALAAVQQTLAHDPDDVRALRGACVALGKLGRMNDAARVCRRALDRAPGDLETRRALATIYYDGGAYKWSATEWRHVVAHAPRDGHARRALRNAEARADRG